MSEKKRIPDEDPDLKASAGSEKPKADEYSELLMGGSTYRSNIQLTKLRYWAFYLSIAVISVMVVFLFIVLCLVISRSESALSSEAQIAVFTAPIVATSAVTIFIVKGIFSSRPLEEGTDETLLGAAKSIGKDMLE